MVSKFDKIECNIFFLLDIRLFPSFGSDELTYPPDFEDDSGGLRGLAPPDGTVEEACEAWGTGGPPWPDMLITLQRNFFFLNTK